MATNTTWPEYRKWLLSKLQKTGALGVFSRPMHPLTRGLEEKSTGESFILQAPATDSTTCTKPDVKISYTSGLQITWSGISKLTPELEEAIAALAKTFASTISSQMEREMMTTCGYFEEKQPPRTVSLSRLQSEYPELKRKPPEGG